MLLLFFSVIAIYFIRGFCASECDPSSKWMRESTLDKNGQMTIKWNFTEKDITMIMIASTTGWVAVGFGPKEPKFVDLSVGWVSMNKSQVQDLYLKDNSSEPTMDKNGSIELIGGAENTTSTYVCFKRKIISCDEQDYIITEGTTKVTWAFGKEDPKDGKLQYQSATKGEKLMHLLSVTYPKPTGQTYTLQARNSTISSKEGTTLYWCSIFEVPPMTDQHYMIGWDAFVPKQSMGIVHHIGTYVCNAEKMSKIYNTIDPQGSSCKNKSMAIIIEFCKEFISIWAMGGEDQYFPPESGTPFGSPNSKTYYRLEIHYNLPKNKPEYKDDTAMKFYITKEKPKNVIGILLTGVQVLPFILIPPNQKNFSVIGLCEPKCLQKNIKDGAITITAFRFHAHLTAKTFKLHIFRDNKELEPVVENNFDFEFQGFRYLTKEIKVFPNDRLVAECIYDTTSKNVTTVGAETTEEEMCAIYIMYYPKMDDLALCLSFIKPEGVYNLTGIEEVGNPSGSLPCNTSDCQSPLARKAFTPPIPVIKPAKYANQTLDKVLKSFSNWTADNIDKMQKFFYGEQNPVCIGGGSVYNSKSTDSIRYPTNAVPYKLPDTCGK